MDAPSESAYYFALFRLCFSLSLFQNSINVIKSAKKMLKNPISRSLFYDVPSFFKLFVASLLFPVIIRVYTFHHLDRS